MNRLLLAALSFGLASPAFALGSAESSLGAASAAFTALSGFKLKTAVRSIEAKTGAPAAASVIKAGAPQSKFVTLRGFVTVQGQGYVPGGPSGYVFITVSGDTQLQDNSGHYLSGFVTVSDSSGYFVNGNYVNGWPRPSAMVTLYRNGRYLGSIRVDGSIPVSGFNSGGWIHLTGSGWVEGSGYIQDDEPQVP